MAKSNILLESGTNELEIVEFTIDEAGSDGSFCTSHYGVNVAKVLEIIRKPQVTALPDTAHPCVLGAFNLRSRIIPLIDLSRWLGKPMRSDENAKVVVTEFNNVINAFLVSGVNRIHRISWEQVEAPDKNLTLFTGGSITGMVKFEDRIILILDMEKIIAELNPELAVNVDEDHPPIQPEDEQPIRVLIADDSPTILKTLTRGLERAGFTVTSAVNGRDAWDQLLDIKEKTNGGRLADRLDLVVSDIEMPVMDGHNLCKRIKDDPILRQLPVILFSSLISDRLRHKGEAVGADDQIAKPNVQTLTERIRELLGRPLVSA